MPFWQQQSLAWYRCAALSWHVKLAVVFVAAVVPLAVFLWLTSGCNPGSYWQHCYMSSLYAQQQQAHSAAHKQLCAVLPDIQASAQTYGYCTQQPVTASAAQALGHFVQLCAEHGLTCTAIKPRRAKIIGLVTVVDYAVTLHAEFTKIVAFCAALGTQCPTWSIYPTRITRTQQGAVDAELVLAFVIASTKEPVYVPSQGHNAGGNFGTHSVAWQHSGTTSTDS